MNETPLPPSPSERPGPAMSSSELASTMSHFHRAEVARMAGWRDRIDRTTNWSITVVAALLSVTLSTQQSHHGVLLFGMLLVLLLLWIEARRYRFFDVYRSRVRQFERYYFAQIFSPQDDFSANWLPILAAGLREPRFLISQTTAFSRRLRRNYIYMFWILLLGWVLKITTPALQIEGTTRTFANSLREVLVGASLGPVPGIVVIALVAVFYAGIAYAAIRSLTDSDELRYGNVHV
jgi:uncharacterized membrane protein